MCQKVRNKKISKRIGFECGQKETEVSVLKTDSKK